MKKLFFLAIIAMLASACDIDDFINPRVRQPPNPPEEFDNPLNNFTPNQLGSKENPIVIDDTDFIEGVVYTVTNCENEDIVYSPRYRNGRLIVTVSNSGISTFTRFVELTPEGCGTLVENTDVIGPIYQSGFYYMIRGEVLRLSDFPSNPFFQRGFFREIPDSDQVQFATIFPIEVNSQLSFRDPTRNPIPDKVLSCDNVPSWLDAQFSDTEINVGDYYLTDGVGGQFINRFDESRRLIELNKCFDN